jgi:hypothetical protein
VQTTAEMGAASVGGDLVLGFAAALALGEKHIAARANLW